MKNTATNVIVGALVVATVLYFLYPKTSTYEGFETNPGGIIGMVFVAILGVGILFALLGSMTQTNGY